MKKPKKKNKKPKKKNKIYYVQDGNYRYDLPKKYQDYLWSLCKKYKVTDYYKLFIAQMYHESNFDESVISETNNYGLMQINKCNHSWLSKKLKNGDKAKLTDLSGNTVTYQVYDKKVIEPTDVSCTSQMLARDMQIRELTLITCTNGGKQRLVVKLREV